MVDSTDTDGRRRPVAVVTGGAGGIGAEICRHLAAAGQQVAVTDLVARPAEEVAKGLEGDGHLGLAMDVADTGSVRAALGEVAGRLGPVDVLVNVAGWDEFRPFVETEPEFWDRVIAINYKGPLNTIHTVLPSMIERGGGKIVSVASDAARVGSSLEAVYSGAKGAVVAFSKSVAREVARYGISVNVVCPGPTDTPLIRDAAEQLGGGDRFIDALTKAIPMRRMGTPSDIAPAVAFLASGGAGFITGQTLSVSGGLTMA